MSIVGGALNNAASKKYDLEGWFPGYGEYRELVSCSNCTDYQSRALNIKYGTKVKGESSDKNLVHLLNSTLCATGRAMCAIVENYQTEEGIKIPTVLQPFLGNKKFIPYDEKCLAEFVEEQKAEEVKKAKKSKGKGKAKGDKEKPKEEVTEKKQKVIASDDANTKPIEKMEKVEKEEKKDASAGDN